MSTGVANYASLNATTVASDGISPLINGAECSAPAAIDATVYMSYGTGSRLNNLHRPRHVEGVCDKIHNGTVRVGFWVGNCKSFGSADAYTGWNSVSRMFVEEIPPPQA